MKFYGSSKTGPVRSSNQDAFFAHQLQSGVFIAAVCDGMGGAAAGNVASKTAVKIMSEQLRSSFAAFPDEDFDSEYEIKRSFFDADDGIRELVSKHPEYAGMGTTAVLLVAYGDTAYVAHVGDSRCYNLDGETLTRLTKDHSYVQMLIDNNEITESEAETHPNKNIITRSIGGIAKASPDISMTKVKGQFLLCSDGLTNYVTEDRILEIMISAPTPQKAVTKLVSEAIKNGGGDNVTALIADFSE